MTHQQPTTNRAFQEMRKPALDRLADRVPEELSARTGIPFDRQRQVFSLSSLGRNMEIDYPGYEIRPAVDDWHHLLILHYLDLADGTPLSHQLMAFGDLPSGMGTCPVAWSGAAASIGKASGIWVCAWAMRPRRKWKGPVGPLEAS